jgi:hypothetical protein
MAENKIDVDILINTAESARTLGELKKAMKDLKGSINDVSDTDFNRLSQSLNDVEGKLGDMNDMAKNVSGSGIERLNASIGSLQEGLMSADPGKLSAGMKGLGAAMDAIPIFLLIEGLKYVYDNFDKVSEIVKQVTGGFSDEEMAVKRTTKALELQTETTSKLVKQYDREIALLEASGASEEEIIFIKKKKIQAQIDEAKAIIASQDTKIMEIKANDDLSESLARATAWIQRKLGNDKAAEIYEQGIAAEKQDRIKEEEKKRTEAAETIADLENSLDVLDAEYDGKKRDRWKKSQEEKTKIAEEEGEKRYQAWKAEQQKIADENAIVIPEQAEFKVEVQTEADRKLVESALKAQEEIDQAKKDKIESDKAIAESEKKGLEAGKAISDALFAWKMRGASNNAAQELKIRKQMFAVDKAFNIARATQDGIRSVQAALTIPPPGGQILAGINATIAAANIAKIAATQFNGGGAGGGGSISSGGGGGNISTNTPAFQAPTFFGLGQVTGPSQNNGASTQRVYVTETDISKVQNRVSVIESRAKIG